LGITFVILALAISALTACGGNTAAPDSETGESLAGESLTLPQVATLVEPGDRLQVVATTSIIGDVIRQVGGDAIDLVVLMQPGQDPHSYQPGAADLTAAADAHVIFVNGWNLEEGLVDDLVTIGRDAAIVPISAGIEPREMTSSADEESEEAHDEMEVGEEDHAHGPLDPHVWQDVSNVMLWVENVRQILSAADPDNAATYATNAERYRVELDQLDADLSTQFETIPAERRVLITNHESLGYLADAYGFEVVGTIIPSVSTLAEPTAAALAELVNTMRAEDICTILLETTASDQLARTLENELAACDEVGLITLYTGSLGPGGSDADTYIGMMRANAAALVEGLR
jgi:ABC-type Zn uptake system ZnuABC Zn-binding protein ZnuA